MRFWIGSMLAALLVAMPLLGQGKAADEKGNDRTKQLDQMKQDFQKAVEKANKELKAVKSQEGFEKIVNKLSKEYTDRVVKLAESNPKDKVSGDVLFWGVSTGLPLQGNKVYELLADNWAKDPRVKLLCQRMTLMTVDDSAEKLLDKVIEENKDKDIQGLAYYVLAKMKKDQSESKGDVKAGAKAEKMFEKTSTDFAEVKMPRGTVGAESKNALAEMRKLGVGKKMPNLESEKLDGKKDQLRGYKGKIVVLDVWATWCGPCKAMIPHEREMVEKLKDKPFALISISGDAQKDTLKKFLEKEEMPWTHWWNGQRGGIITDWNVRFYPTIYVLDRKGVIRYKHIRGKELEEAVEKLLAEREKVSR